MKWILCEMGGYAWLKNNKSTSVGPLNNVLWPFALFLFLSIRNSFWCDLFQTLFEHATSIVKKDDKPLCRSANFLYSTVKLWKEKKVSIFPRYLHTLFYGFECSSLGEEFYFSRQHLLTRRQHETFKCDRLTKKIITIIIASKILALPLDEGMNFFSSLAT